MTRVDHRLQLPERRLPELRELAGVGGQDDLGAPLLEQRPELTRPGADRVEIRLVGTSGWD